ncbi:Salicylate biosynthesis isochorismate synthase [compost metagenome]
MRTQTSLLTLEARIDVLDQAIERARRTGRPVLVAMATRPVREDLRDRLLDAPASPKVAWTELSSGIRRLGLDLTDALRAFDAEAAWESPDQARELLENAVCAPEIRDELRVFGGIAFDPTTPPHPSWPDGSPARFVLPRVLVKQTHAEATLFVTDWAQPEDAVDDLLSRFEDALRGVDDWSEASLPAGLAPAEPELAEDARDRWFSQVESALGHIQAGDVTKIVLSRDLPVRSEGPIPMGAVIRGLEAIATSGTVFGLQFEPGSAFVGATPELLVSVSGDVVESDCLAGTTKRTGDPEEDDRLALALLADDKERREHAYVITAVTEALAPLCESFDVPETPTLMVLPTLQHLHSPAQGRLREGVALGTILRRLHPTPAVGGTPRLSALGLIHDLEARPRGWYAGAIGWIGADAARFSVGIRSAVLHPDGAIVFGGCGIVRGSDPAAEWDETQRKAATLLNLLTQGRSS